MSFFSRILTLLKSFRHLSFSRAELLLKIIVLEQQLVVFKQHQPRPKISKLDRIVWVWLRRLWKKWKELLIFVKPDTVIRWHRQGFRLYWRSISERGIGKNKGKPPIDKEIVQLIQRFLNENPTWRAPRIHGELLKLGFKVSERSVSRYLRDINPSHSNSSKWMTFLTNQRKGIAAMDLFVVPTLFFKRLFVFFIISHDRRQIIHFAVTYHPTALWISQQIRKAFSSADFSHIKYMIHDRDGSFSTLVRQTLKSLGIESVRTSVRSPWQNGVAERWIGSCRRELLNHVIIFHEKHLILLLSEYVDYYNDDRTHYNLDKDPPTGRPVQHRQSDEDKVIALPRVSGLHHKYVWKDAA